MKYILLSILILFASCEQNEQKSKKFINTSKMKYSFLEIKNSSKHNVTVSIGNYHEDENAEPTQTILIYSKTTELLQIRKDENFSIKMEWTDYSNTSYSDILKFENITDHISVSNEDKETAVFSIPDERGYFLTFNTNELKPVSMYWSVYDRYGTNSGTRLTGKNVVLKKILLRSGALSHESNPGAVSSIFVLKTGKLSTEEEPNSDLVREISITDTTGETDITINSVAYVTRKSTDSYFFTITIPIENKTSNYYGTISGTYDLSGTDITDKPLWFISGNVVADKDRDIFGEYDPENCIFPDDKAYAIIKVFEEEKYSQITGITITSLNKAVFDMSDYMELPGQFETSALSVIHGMGLFQLLPGIKANVINKTEATFRFDTVNIIYFDENDAIVYAYDYLYSTRTMIFYPEESGTFDIEENNTIFKGTSSKIQIIYEM